ncbi:MAG: 3-hydroxybenzoate 6-monooxygenase [Steroidobacteraceae bacterium]
MAVERAAQSLASVSDFVVAGGGIGGLAAALALARHGLTSVVLERADSFAELGAGIQIGPNAFHALDELGIGAAVKQDAVLIDELVMLDGLSGERILGIEVGESFPARYCNPYAVIHRADLHRALLEACRASDFIVLMTDARVVGFEQSGLAVNVRCANGATLRGRALLGADGLRSVIRSLVIGDGEPRVSGHVTFRATLLAEQMPAELRWNAAAIWVGPSTHVVHYPLRGSRLFNLVATSHGAYAAEEHNIPADPREVLPLFEHLCAQPLGLMHTPREFRRWVLCDREPVENWTRGNVTLLGDAAHPMLQYFAQGACMALEDAVCLAHEASRSPSQLADALLRYQQARVSRTARVQISSRLLGDIYHASGALRLVRRDMYGSRSQEEFLRSLDWIYGHRAA